MDAEPTKRRKRRIKKIKVKQPSGFKLKMANFLGPSYLEYSRQINIAIALALVFFVGLIVLMAMTAPPAAEITPELNAP